MKRSSLVLIVALVIASEATRVDCQEQSAATLDTLELSPFVGLGSSVPQGYSLDLAMAYPIFAVRNFPMFLRLSLGLSSSLQLTYTNEPVVANMIGLARPMNVWGAKFQILPAGEGLASFVLWLRGSINSQNEYLGPNDIQSNLPPDASKGLTSCSYEYSTSSAGVSVRPSLHSILGIDVSIGLLQLELENTWLSAGISGYHSTGPDRALLLDMSAAASIRLFPSLAVLGGVGTFPYVDVDHAALRLQLHQTYSGTLGVRYFLPINLQADAYLRWQSSYNAIARREFRFGLSSLVPFR